MCSSCSEYPVDRQIKLDSTINYNSNAIYKNGDSIRLTGKITKITNKGGCQIITINENILAAFPESQKRNVNEINLGNQIEICGLVSLPIPNEYKLYLSPAYIVVDNKISKQ